MKLNTQLDILARGICLLTGINITLFVHFAWKGSYAAAFPALVGICASAVWKYKYLRSPITETVETQASEPERLNP